MNKKPDTTIVDDDDQVIAYKHWTDVQPGDRVRISSIMLTNSQGQVLIAQRSHKKVNQPGKWGPSAAGTIEPNETYESNAYKELEEEIGVSGIPLTLVATVKWDGSPTDRRYSACFRGQCDWPIEQFVLQEEEVAAVKWISVPDLLQELKANPDQYLPNTYAWLKAFNLVD